MDERVMVSTVRAGKGWIAIAYTRGPEVVSDSTISRDAGEAEKMVSEDLRARHIDFSVVPGDDSLEALASRIIEGDSSVPISHRGISAFKHDVFEFVRRIPKGKVASYSDVARGIGRPRAMRAVGTTMATHCLSYIIPCHRVVKNDLSPGGFSSTRSKAEMLREEGVEFEGDRVREKHRLARGK